MSESRTRLPRPLSPAQLHALRVLQEMSDAMAPGSPSLAELAPRLGLANRSSCHRVIGYLIRKGYVAREPGKARSLRLLRRLTPPPQDILRDIVMALERGLPTADGTLRVEIPLALAEAARAAIAEAAPP